MARSLLGDGNVHLSCVLRLPAVCHCRQASSDAAIVKLLGETRTLCLNPLTLCLNQLIDLVLPDAVGGIAGNVDPETVRETDHSLFVVSVPRNFKFDYAVIGHAPPSFNRTRSTKL